MTDANKPARRDNRCLDQPHAHETVAPIQAGHSIRRLAAPDPSDVKFDRGLATPENCYRNEPSTQLSSGPLPERGERGAHEVGGAPVGVELGYHGQVLA